MMHLATFSSLLFALASATPLKRQANSELRLASFDDINGIPLVSATAVDRYEDVYWNGMSLVKSPNLGIEPGSAFHSPPNCAAYSALDVITVEQGQPAMLADYPDSNIDTFDLTSFWFGCVVGSEETVASVPQQCTVTVRGYSDDDTIVGEKMFTFSKTGLRPPMIEAPVGMLGLTRAEFFVSNSATTAALLDDVAYTVYLKSTVV